MEPVTAPPEAPHPGTLSRFAETADAIRHASGKLEKTRLLAEFFRELPDEDLFTPRMQAMQALAQRRELRAGEVLAELVRTGPDESIRMEAARHLERFSEQPRPREALRIAATSDSSPYVRLAALQSLKPTVDATLAPVLERRAGRQVQVLPPGAPVSGLKQAWPVEHLVPPQETGSHIVVISLQTSKVARQPLPLLQICTQAGGVCILSHFSPVPQGGSQSTTGVGPASLPASGPAGGPMSAPPPPGPASFSS